MDFIAFNAILQLGRTINAFNGGEEEELPSHDDENRAKLGVLHMSAE